MGINRIRGTPTKPQTSPATGQKFVKLPNEYAILFAERIHAHPQSSLVVAIKLLLLIVQMDDTIWKGQKITEGGVGGVEDKEQ